MPSKNALASAMLSAAANVVAPLALSDVVELPREVGPGTAATPTLAAAFAGAVPEEEAPGVTAATGAPGACNALRSEGDMSAVG